LYFQFLATVFQYLSTVFKPKLPKFIYLKIRLKANPDKILIQSVQFVFVS